MLDTETKRRIDTARDILVGKVPDPKSQVEQITIALIYKFMDDMDAEAEELGGRRKFFAGKFAKYGWEKLLHKGLGGHEALSLYSEGIARMPENPGIPELFRDIFKNAYLPYRDPETLKAFLKTIDDFRYDHSESLGDAFEYLLSVLGSQGDAGQFRTPRHIIDFLVQVIDPQKHESILDPACGTAGFLISAWKHILSSNVRDGRCALTPDERSRLAENIRGYDISPDMVRLSLANLYLHGFVEPHVSEYDTLTSEERWHEYADVILANPPFMSPKGGIKPHKRFSVQSKRSEVLFVDYMAEHLNLDGRAGIIVPEGIIFQSQGAYKELRRKLVQDFLVAVISLPAGVFQPYSGVKTSILVLDKATARRADSIAFFKVENDGFSLGAQRRPIDKDDLPTVLAELTEYRRRLHSSKSLEGFAPAMGQIVPKAKIVENGDYNLSGERYREGKDVSAAWPLVSLGKLSKRYSGGTPSKSCNEFWKGDIPWVSPKDMKVPVLFDAEDHVSLDAVKSSATTLLPAGALLCVVRSGILKHSLPLAITGCELCFNQDIIALVPDSGRLDIKYLFYVLKCQSEKILQEGIKPGVTVQSFHSGFFDKYLLPLPPLEVQKEIVAEIEGYQRVIDGARQVVDNYRPHIAIDPEWPKKTLDNLAENLDNKRIPITKEDRKPGMYPYYGASGIVDWVDGYIFDEDILLVSEDGANLLARSTPIAFEVSGKCWVNNHAHALKFLSRTTSKFVEVYLNSIAIDEFVTGAAQPKLNQSSLNRIPIPIPNDTDVQQAIVAEIEAEQALVNANKELIARFEKKIQAVLDRVWGAAA